MGFEAELRAYLERLAQAEGADRDPVHRRIDEHALRAYFLERLRTLEATSAGAAVAEATFRIWSPRIGPFAQYIANLPAGVAPLLGPQAQEFAERALEAHMGLLPARPRGVVEQLELDRITDEFRPLWAAIAAEVDRYAVETYLVRDEPVTGPRLTALGTAFLRLRGKDAIRWLITSELLQSIGRWDSWRTPRELLEVALQASGITSLINEYGDQVTLFDAKLLVRLADLGVLDRFFFDDDDQTGWYRAADTWRGSIRAMLGTSPWHQAISAILSEDRTGLTPALRAPDEGVAEQTKMIAHEVRNALVPARFQLDALRGVVSEPHVARVDAAKRGVTRVLTFVEEMLATSELIAEPATPCDLAALLRDAISWLEGGEHIQVVTSPICIRVQVPRTQLVRAISNVLRNALQATPEARSVEVGTHHLGALARIVVDDSGPGVPEQAREQVFLEGYTTRREGSGYGLAYVRRVVVDTLRGRVWCEASHLGGARFVIELPGIEAEP